MNTDMFAEAVLRIQTVDRDLLFQQIASTFRHITTMSDKEVVVAWQTLDLIEASGTKEVKVITQKFKVAAVARMADIIATRPFIEKAGVVATFRAVVGTEEGKRLRSFLV